MPSIPKRLRAVLKKFRRRRQAHTPSTIALQNAAEVELTKTELAVPVTTECWIQNILMWIQVKDSSPSYNPSRFSREFCFRD